MATLAEHTAERPATRPKRRAMPFTLGSIASHLQSLPLWLILGFFLLLPILLLVVVSFWDYDFARMYPAFVWTNYIETLGSWVTWKTTSTP